VQYPVARFDLSVCVNSGQVFRWRKLADGSWLGVDGDAWYRAYPPVLLDAGQAEMRVESNVGEARFRDLFRLDWDADEIEAEILRLAPEMEPYMQTFAGLRLMKPSSAEETFFCFLCTPNNNIARITQMTAHLGSYGPAIDTVGGVKLHAFPNVQQIADLSESELRAKAFGYRAATIPNAARQVLERGEDWIIGLRNVPYEEARRELMGIKGIGPKLADCIALFALHHTEAVPIDTHIWQAFTRLYYPEWKDKAVTDSRYREASESFRKRFGTLTGWAHQYLFYDNMINWRSRNV